MMYPKSVSARRSAVKRKRVMPEGMGERACWLCGRNGCADPLDRHHIFGGALRRKSEQYGAVVDLCHSRCHESGPEAVHRDSETMRRLHEYGQRMLMDKLGWTTADFIREFGRNYL